MSTKFVAAVAVLTAVGAAVALAQGQQPKASKADVQRLVDSIKADKTKFSQYCEITKLEIQGDSIAQKNRNDPKLQDIGRQMQAAAAKLGPDYTRIISSQLDNASSALFDDLSKSCNVGFQAAQAAPKASKGEVQKLVDGIKSDKTKFSQFCDLTKLEVQGEALAQKNQNDPKLQALGQKMQEMSGKLGPDYERITTSELDDASTALLDDLSKGCK
jgi:uncharacterized protein (DUF927 family)